VQSPPVAPKARAAKVESDSSTYFFVGSGIASLAGAVYLIRDGGVAGKNIVILEESQEVGGALDAHGDAATGYFMSGSRMFESKYNCTFDLLSSIPSTTDPTVSVTAETNRVSVENSWDDKARLVDFQGKVTDFHSLGFTERDRLDLLTLLAAPENALNAQRISDWFTPPFFQTNFWYEWCTLFAFQPWHSVIEFRRYLLRFMHRFATIDTQQGIYRTKYNQYESIATPVVAWLRERGVEIRFGTSVTNLGFKKASPGTITVDAIECTVDGTVTTQPVGGRDCVFVTNGSMTADKAFGSNSLAPALDRSKRSGAWRLWETLARGRPEFGRPAVFDDHVDESVWESFTVTDSAPLVLEFLQAFTGSVPGRGGLITFKDSNWLITISIFHQPFFMTQPENVAVWWGYGLYYDQPGNYVKKAMSQCTGREILEEVLGHLHLSEADKGAVLASSKTIPCAMPYITSQFLVRKAGDRPDVVPKGSTNLAFVGQYCEQPDDVVFTVEYSIRSAQAAVYTLLRLDKKPTPIYKGAHDPRVLFEALETLRR
jgi:oleate hydratase